MKEWLTPITTDPSPQNVTHIASYNAGSLCGIPWAKMVADYPNGHYIPPTLVSTARLDGTLLQDALMRHVQMATCLKCREIFLRGVFASKTEEENK